MTIPSWPFDSLSLLLAQSLIDNRPPSSFFRSPPAHWIAWQNNRRISLAASNWMLEILPRSDAWEGLDKLARLRVEAELVVFIEEEVRAKRWSPEQMPDVRRPVPSLPFLNWLHLRAENGQRPRMSHTVGLEVKKLAERYGFSLAATPSYSVHSLARSSRPLHMYSSSAASVYQPVARWTS